MGYCVSGSLIGKKRNEFSIFNVQFSMRRLLIIMITFFFVHCLFGQEVKKIKITDLQKTIAESKTPLIVNFWATFCVPCLEEIPYFQEAVKKHKADGVQLILVSLDLQEAYPMGIKRTITKRKITAPVQWLDETNADYFCPKVDSAWSGGMPASLFINNSTGYHKFFEEKLSNEKLEKEIMAILGKTD
jgi:thiol-disulfide isomerase/thioredoxin